MSCRTKALKSLFFSLNLFCWELLNLLTAVEVSDMSLTFSPERKALNYDQHCLYLISGDFSNDEVSIKGH